MSDEQREKRLFRWSEAVRLVDEGRAHPRTVECIELVRSEGLGMREIAERLGIGVSTVGNYLTDPTREKDRERKERVFGFCSDCGCKIFNSGSLPGERCSDCSVEHRRIEERKRIIEAIQDWNRRYGSPPAAMDWNVPMAHSANIHADRLALIEQRHRDRDWPGVKSAQAAFGSWNAAIEAAGFQPLRRGFRRDPDTHREHLKGRRKMLSPTTVIDREIEKNEKRKENLAEQIGLLDKNIDQLKEAKAVLGKAA